MKVDQYILPKFQVEVAVPAHILYSDGKVPVTIKASYTYGKLLEGEATLKCLNMVLNSIQVNGTATVDVELVKDLQLSKLWYDQSLHFEVEFQDTLTSKFL